ncbi:hypothetical protein [Aquitalea magnusonii]|uniref:hypothetical protein n=1 Tax=Aquitalea magnusonii TaxID=332411 RepID=UPI0011AE7D02|nr:hypothetical protein [Aquitalea magnusonii]
MEKLIDKISAYNIFTNLFPGVVYSILVEKIWGLSLIDNNNLSAAFFYYFCGMVISRVSSIMVEPFLKKVKFVEFSEYKKYIKALAKDEQIATLLETSNVYRSVIALLVCVLATGMWVYFSTTATFIAPYMRYIILFLLLTLFLFSYKKQTKYIVARIEHHSKDNEASQ